MKVKPQEELEEFLQRILTPLGITVVEAEFEQGKNPALTVYIDKEGGVDLTACETAHRAIDLPLDEFDPTYGAPYTLNVSSLGIDRPFKKPKDFESHLNSMVEVWLKVSVGGKKQYDGELCYYDGEVIRLKVSKDKTLTFDLKKQVKKVNEYIDF